MKSQITPTKSEIFTNKWAESLFWNLTTETIGVYLWFLKFSNVLLKLIQ